MKYWKFGNGIIYNATDKMYSNESGWKEITKTEYDKEVTLPKMSDNNLVHNYFNGAEQGLRTAKILYLETIKDDPTKLSNFKAYMKASTTADIERSITFYNSKLAGDTDNVAINKATSKVIPQTNFDAIAGRTNFLQWAIVEFPNLRQYIEAVNSLNYSTFLTEDEPE